MRKSFLILFGAVALLAIVFYPLFDTLASNVRSSKLKRSRCKTHNNFKTSDDVYARGENLPPLTNVDVYVVPNKKWRRGDPIGSDVSSDGPETVATDSDGDFPCEKIWGSSLARGRFDIVVDANQDGTFNNDDDVDGKGNDGGFRVR